MPSPRAWMRNETQTASTWIWILLVNSIFYNHHHHGMLVVQIPLTLSCHPSLSAIALCKSSRQHPVFTQSWWSFKWLNNTGVSICRNSWGKLLKSLSLPQRQYPACLAHLILMVWEIGGKWLYNSCFLAYCFQDLYKTVCIILV